MVRPALCDHGGISQILVVLLLSSIPLKAVAQAITCPEPPRIETMNTKAKIQASFNLLSKLISNIGGGIEYERSANNALRQFDKPDDMYKVIYALYINCVQLKEEFPNDPGRRRREFNEVFFKLTSQRLEPDRNTVPLESLRAPSQPVQPANTVFVEPPPTASKSTPSAILPSTLSKSPATTAPSEGLTPREQWEYLYKLPTRKGYHHVIVASIANEDQAFEQLEKFQQRFPNIAFSLHDTLGLKNNQWYAIFIGSGLTKEAAIKLRDWARENGLPKDTYTYLQNLTPECVSLKMEKGGSYKCE